MMSVPFWVTVTCFFDILNLEMAKNPGIVPSITVVADEVRQEIFRGNGLVINKFLKQQLQFGNPNSPLSLEIDAATGKISGYEYAGGEPIYQSQGTAFGFTYGASGDWGVPSGPIEGGVTYSNLVGSLSASAQIDMFDETAKLTFSSSVNIGNNASTSSGIEITTNYAESAQNVAVVGRNVVLSAALLSLLAPTVTAGGTATAAFAAWLLLNQENLDYA